MKTLIQTLSLVLTCAVVGCNTPAYTDACASAQNLYTKYQAAEAAGLITDAKTIEEAKKAGVYLALACGWTKTRGVDRNGVPIVHPPQ